MLIIRPMKILNVSRIREADAYTIAHEPVSSEALMERAAAAAYKRIVSLYGRHPEFVVFCGMGNNGGDGLVIARLMASRNVTVRTVVVNTGGNPSPDFSLNLKKLNEMRRQQPLHVSHISEMPPILPGMIVVDAIFGSGLNRPAEGLAAEIIQTINQSRNEVIAIDIPSGLFGEDNSQNTGPVIEASCTLTFEFPKLSFFFPENGRYTGRWEVVPIGLHPDYIRETEADKYWVLRDDCRPLLRQRKIFSHKGDFGHALLIAGSYGKAGAAVLAASSCMHSGAGLLTVHAPRSINVVMQTAVPEAMFSADEGEMVVSGIPDVQKYNAVAAGPGLGSGKETESALKLLLQSHPGPMVLDADALNIRAANKTWMAFLPPSAILTPHPGEWRRLSGESIHSSGRLEKQIEMSVRFGIIIILKGAFTCISLPSGKCYFNSTGNPGMATAGSGDVLTGILLALLAQGYKPAEAAILGVYLHGKAGDLAAARHGHEALTASDITEMLGRAFRSLY